MPRPRGLTLAELLVALAVLSVIAMITVPTLSFDEARRLDAAALRTGQALRLARSEAMRSGGPVLVDAETSPGKLQLLRRDCVFSGTPPAVLDPLSRQPYVEDITGSAHAGGVVMTTRFLVAGTPYAGLVFDPSGAAARACSVAAGILRGTPEPGTSIELAYAGRSRSIAIDPPTGRVSGLEP